MEERTPAEENGETAATDARLSGATLLDAVGDGVYQLDRDGRFVAVNDALAELTGYDRETLVGSHASKVLDAEDVVRAETAIRELLAGDGGSTRLTLPVFTAGGEAVACEVRVSALRLAGEFGGTVGVVREVTDRATAASVRDASERRQAFDALAEASADGIIMLDDDSNIRYANPAVERILGYTPEELVGGSKMTIIPERLRRTHAEALQRYLDTGDKHIDWTYVELPGLHRDGHEVPLAISLNEFEHDGEHYFVGTFRDISTRKEVEAELERQNDRLERFASMLAHELRNPLSIAQVYLDFLDDGEGDEATLDEIADALERIDEIIDVLLVLARGRDEIGDLEAVGLADVASAAWDAIETGGSELAVDTALAVRANATHLRQLLENLFRNAVQHSDGAVTVRVGTLTDESAGGDSTAEAAGFYVEDTGPGIPEADREAVLEAGYTTDDDGIGLGLTFVAELAAAYGWEYDIAESEAGGARFEFTGVESVDG